MKKMMYFKKGLLLSVCITASSLNAIDSLTGLGQNVSAFALDKANNIVYAGFAAANGTSSLIKVTPQADGTAPVATAIAPATTNLNGTAATANPLNNAIVSSIALSMNGTTPRLVCVNGTANTNSLQVSSNDGTVVGVSTGSAAGTGPAVALNDAEGNAISAGGIRAITASPSYTFAAVADNGGTTWATEGGRGIAWGKIHATTLAPVMSIPVNGDASAGAYALPVLGTAQATGRTLAVGSAATVANAAPSLAFDADMNMLYVGTQVTAADTTSGDRAISVLAASVSPTAFAFVSTVANTAAFDTNNNIIQGTRNTAVSAINIAVMTTPTGFKYLIVNGGNGLAANVSGQVYAIPLVTGVTDATLGTFAKNDLNSPDFTVQASGSGDLARTISVEAIVGTEVGAPFTVAATAQTNLLYVVSDCVYIANSSASNGSTIESAIYYSRPEYNQNGKIVRWTRWARAVPTAIGTSETDGAVAAFAVDATVGKAWAVPAGTENVINVSSYGAETGANQLATLANAALGDGCFSALSLDGTTINWTKGSLAHYGIFGGFETVFFARTSVANDTGFVEPEVTTGADYSGAAVSKTIATGLSGAGAVTSLGLICPGMFENQTFILAGTQNGLYALAGSGAGVAGLGGTAYYEEEACFEELNDGFFGAAYAPTWQQLTSVSGQVTKIVSSSNATFILARDTDTDGAITDTLYMYENSSADTTVTEVNTALVKLAVSGVSATNSDLSAATLINDFVVINGVANGADSQVVLATNAGLYQSKTDSGVEFAGDQTGALWSPTGYKQGNSIADSDYSQLFTNPTTNLNCSFTGFKFKNGDLNLQTYPYSASDMFGATDNDEGTTGNKIVNIVNTNTSSTTSFKNLNRMLHYWSDGCRRFFISSTTGGASTLQVIPWSVTTWNVTDPVMSVQPAGNIVYCIALLSNGYLAFGTDEGIVLL